MLLDAAAYKVRNSQFTNAGVVPVRQRRETLSAALNKAGAAVAKNVRDSLYAQISNIERRRVVPKPDLDRLNDALDVVETLTPRLQAAFLDTLGTDTTLTAAALGVIRDAENDFRQCLHEAGFSVEDISCVGSGMSSVLTHWTRLGFAVTEENLACYQRQRDEEDAAVCRPGR